MSGVASVARNKSACTRKTKMLVRNSADEDDMPVGATISSTMPDVVSGV